MLNAGVGLTAAIAIFSYAINLELSRGYVLIALPSTTLFDLVTRYAMRKRLHQPARDSAAACSAWWRSAMRRRWPTWSRNSAAIGITG